MFTILTKVSGVSGPAYRMHTVGSEVSLKNELVYRYQTREGLLSALADGNIKVIKSEPVFVTILLGQLDAHDITIKD